MKTLSRPTNPHEMSKPCPIRFSARVLAPCVCGGHGGHSALLQEEQCRETQLMTPLHESMGHGTFMVGTGTCKFLTSSAVKRRRTVLRTFFWPQSVD